MLSTIGCCITQQDITFPSNRKILLTDPVAKVVKVDLLRCRCKTLLHHVNKWRDFVNICGAVANTKYYKNYFQFFSDAQPSQDLSSRWNNTADTVVIGGGIAGCSVAYHLAKQSDQGRDSPKFLNVSAWQLLNQIGSTILL